jgi:hypothetical protein
VAARLAEERGAIAMRDMCLAQTRVCVTEVVFAPGARADGGGGQQVRVRRRSADEVAAAILCLPVAPLTPLRPAAASGPRCADCHQPIDVESRGGHLSWCPYEGYADFPRAGE